MAGAGDRLKAGDEAGDLTPQLCDNLAYALVGGSLYVTHNCDLADSLGIARVDFRPATGGCAGLMALGEFVALRAT